MKLHNRTRLPDDILSRLLTAAGRSVGARTSGVAVQVNPGRTHARGMAYECFTVRFGKRWEKTDGGCFKISLPLALDPLVAAEVFLKSLGMNGRTSRTTRRGAVGSGNFHAYAMAAARRTTRGPRRFALRTRYTTLIKNSKGVTSTS